jgi:small subunit ribosomal protein S1
VPANNKAALEEIDMDDPVNGSENGLESDFENMLEASFKPSKRIGLGDKIDATVISIGQDYLFLDLGGRSEGLLMKEQIRDKDGELKAAAGDTITVFVTAFRDGATLCGLRAGSGADKPDNKQAVFEALQDAMNADMPVEGTVKESIKGGFSVTIMGERAFCPISQIDNKYCENPEVHLEQTYEFKIIKLEEGGRNIVVSRRVLLEEEAEEKAVELWKKIKVDDTYDGTVSSIKPYGAFVDIGGIDGLLHVSEISYDRVSDPESALEVGQKLTVSIKDVDEKNRKVSLSLKALMQDPWTDAITSFKANQVYKGPVVRITRFGAFVELTPGIEGLVHISQMGAGKHIQTPREVVSEEQEVNVRILEIDMDQRRISLTMNVEDADENWADDLAASKAGQGDQAGMGTLGDLFKNKLKK